MQVSEILSFDSYWSDSRFSSKRPNLRRGLKQAFGDNIYHRDPGGAWIQENSRHSLSNGSPNPGHIETDTGVDAVLVGEDFAYFGGDGPKIPDRFRSGPEMDLVHTGRGHRCKFPAARVANVVEWILSLDTGIQGKPQDW